MNAPLDEFVNTDKLNPNPVPVDDYLPARMINEAAYGPRLFYLMHVEGQFAVSVDTEEGTQVHSRVDLKSDALPSPTLP
jgi:CRISP-associated protein Cas1